MTKTEYKTMRKKFADEAQQLINAGDIEKANAKMQEIRDLDAKFEKEAHALADLQALEGTGVQSIALENFAFGAGEVLGNSGDSGKTTDIYASAEYRNAFMNFMVKGEQLPAEFRNQNAATTSGDTVTVPTHLYEKIFFELEKVGEIYSRVYKTAYPAAIVIAVATAKPTASWVDEDKGSDRQKHQDDKIQFSAYKLDCRVAFSLFTSVVVLEKFESQFVDVIVEAMIKAIEQAILTGSGIGCPKGILTESTDKVVNIAAADNITYDTFVETEALVPASYDSPDTVYLMTKPTFMKYYGITDDNGQPIARINAGINGKPAYDILGRTVIPTDGYMENYADSVDSDTTIAAVFNLKYYIFNEAIGLQLTRFIDQDSDQTVLKAVMLADGKVVDKNSLVKVVKKAT